MAEPASESLSAGAAAAVAAEQRVGLGVEARAAELLGHPCGGRRRREVSLHVGEGGVGAEMGRPE